MRIYAAETKKKYSEFGPFHLNNALKWNNADNFSLQRNFFLWILNVENITEKYHEFIQILNFLSSFEIIKRGFLSSLEIIKRGFLYTLYSAYTFINSVFRDRLCKELAL